jgi:hypothetical protein
MVAPSADLVVAPRDQVQAFDLISLFIVHSSMRQRRGKAPPRVGCASFVFTLIPLLRRGSAMVQER